MSTSTTHLHTIWRNSPRWGRLYARSSHEDGHSPANAGTPLILVHGLVISSRYMVPAAQLLSERNVTTHALDLPGYGLSDSQKHAPTVSQLADALSEWMGLMNISRAHLAGNSYGCQVLAEFAVRYPQKVDRLVLQAPTVDPHLHSFRQQLVRWLQDGVYEPPTLIVLMLRDYFRAGWRVVLETVQEALRDRIEEKLPHIAAPTLVVRGARDPMVSQKWVEEAVQMLPKGELRVIPGFAHAVNYTGALEWVRVMLPFLQLDQKTDAAKGHLSD